MASPQFAAFAAAIAAQRTSDLPSLAELRAGMDAMTQALPPPEGISVVDVDAGGVPAEWVTVTDTNPARTILHLHGGGYCIGRAGSVRNFAGRLAAAADARILSLDYRLAPEYPFPAAVDDAVAAYRWLLSEGTEPSRIAVSGESAGGGLTVALLIALRDANDQLPACAVPISPWVDLENGGEMSREALDGDLLRLEHIQYFAHEYLDGSHPRSPLASPIHATLTGLPPMLVLIGEREILLDDAKRLVERAASEGVDAKLEVVPEMIHFWHLFGPMFPEANEASEAVASFIRSRVQ